MQLLLLGRDGKDLVLVTSMVISWDKEWQE